MEARDPGNRLLYNVHINGFPTPFRSYPTERDAKLFMKEYSEQYPEDRLILLTEVIR